MSDDRGGVAPDDAEALRGTELTAEAARRAVAADDAWLLDVREDDEWDAGHAPEAHHIPLGELADRTGELPDGVGIAVVCRSGHRSSRATAALVEAGYPAVNVVGGMLEWAASGGEVVDGSGGSGSIR